MVVLSLVCGMLGAVLAATTGAAAAATTPAITLTLAKGTYTVKGGTPTRLPTGGKLSARENPSNGTISGGTLTIPSWSGSNTGSTETFTLAQTKTTSLTGRVLPNGDVTISESMSITVHITSPLALTCTSTPIAFTLASTAPYDPTTKSVTVSQATFTIPDFKSTTCGPAQSPLSTTYSGTAGNLITLELQGALTVPEAPTKPSTTVLSASPSTGNTSGQATTLTATVSPVTAQASGVVTISSTGQPMGTVPVTCSTPPSTRPTTRCTSGTASITTSTLAPGTHTLTASFGGDGVFLPSTSPPLTYRVAAAPTVNIDFPSQAALYGPAIRFTGRLFNPANGTTWSNVRLDLGATGVPGLRANITTITTTTGTVYHLTQFNLASCTASYATCSSNLLTGRYNLSGTYGGTAGFPLAAGATTTVYFRLELPRTSTGQTNFGRLNVDAHLVSVDEVGTVQATLATQSSTIDLLPTSKSTTRVGLTVSGALPGSTRQGYRVRIQASVIKNPPIEGPEVRGPISIFLTTTPLGSLPSTGTPAARTMTITHVTWSVGTHVVRVAYTPAPTTPFFDPSTPTPEKKTQVTFTILPPLAGTTYSCASFLGASGGTAVVSAVAATLPTSALPGQTVAVANLHGTMYLDRFFFSGLLPTSPTTFGFTPSGTGTGSATRATTTTNSLTLHLTFTGQGTVTASGTPGGAVTVGLASFRFTQTLGPFFGKGKFTCKPAVAPAPIGTVTLLQPAAPTVTSQPSPQTVPAGQAATFTAAATGTPTPTVQWQSSANGTTWSDIAGATAATTTGGTVSTSYTTPATTATDNTTQYRAVFTNTQGTTPSSGAALTVDVPPTVTTQPGDQAVTAGQPVSFSAAGTGRPTPTVQWQVSTDGGKSFSNVPGASGTTLSFTATATQDQHQYRAVLTNALGSATTQAATLTVTTTSYRLAGSDGAVYCFGDAQFYGSTGGKPLNQPIVGMAAGPGGQGYWLVAGDGGIFAFGDAQFYGSTGGTLPAGSVVGMAATTDAKGYWLAGANGAVYGFGDAPLAGSAVGLTSAPIVAITG